MNLESVHQAAIVHVEASKSSDAPRAPFAPWGASSQSRALLLRCVQQEAAGKWLCFLSMLLLPLIFS